jgi:hypothetical protein
LRRISSPPPAASDSRTLGRRSADIRTWRLAGMEIGSWNIRGSCPCSERIIGEPETQVVYPSSIIIVLIMGGWDVATSAPMAIPGAAPGASCSASPATHIGRLTPPLSSGSTSASVSMWRGSVGGSPRSARVRGGYAGSSRCFRSTIIFACRMPACACPWPSRSRRTGRAQRSGGSLGRQRWRLD